MTKDGVSAILWGLRAGSAVSALQAIFNDGWARTFNAGVLSTMLLVMLMIHVTAWLERRAERKRKAAEAERATPVGRYTDDLSWLRYRDDGR